MEHLIYLLNLTADVLETSYAKDAVEDKSDPFYHQDKVDDTIKVIAEKMNIDS